MFKFIKEFFVFGIKQAYASLFGGALLFVMILTSFWYPINFIHRYDFIFLFAIFFQIFLVLFKLETPKEFLMIFIFHIIATIMEVFKTSPNIGSWNYPEDYVFGIATVPLFTGFMYSAVGSYIARIWRIFEFKFSNYPKQSLSIFLVVLVYINFFTHHFIFDMRWILLVFTFTLFYRTKIYFKVINKYRNMPIILGWFLVAFFIWIAENIATYANIWIYPNQVSSWNMVSLAKISSWFLLMLLSFVMVSTINFQKSRRI